MMSTCGMVSVSLISLNEISVFRPEREGSIDIDPPGRPPHTLTLYSLISSVEQIDILIVVTAQ